MNPTLDPVDRELVRMTQAGLPLVPDPWQSLAQPLGLQADDVRRRFAELLRRGIIRRIAAVPNHYALGYRANGMTVWSLPEAHLEEAGLRLAALPQVSHCYQRPRLLPHWPYNLFAMIHARQHAEAEALVATLRQQLHPLGLEQWDVLYSVRILKKTGLRLHGHGG
ncbi:MAG: hypothetical protein H7831_13665 [Magnetococcus sp. WYHC-3]